MATKSISVELYMILKKIYVQHVIFKDVAREEGVTTDAGATDPLKSFFPFLTISYF